MDRTLSGHASGSLSLTVLLPQIPSVYYPSSMHAGLHTGPQGSDAVSTASGPHLRATKVSSRRHPCAQCLSGMARSQEVHPRRSSKSIWGDRSRLLQEKQSDGDTETSPEPGDDRRGVSSGVEPGREEKSSTQGHVPEAPGDNGSQDRAMSSCSRVEMWAAPGRWVWLATPEE